MPFPPPFAPRGERILLVVLALLLAGCTSQPGVSSLAPAGETLPLPTIPPSPTFEPTLSNPQATLSPSTPEPTSPGSPPLGIYSLKLLTSAVTSPTYLADPGDGSGRLFVVEKSGRILILKGTALAGDPFLDLRDQVGSSGSEQGLLSMAFHPGYPHPPYFYVDYTDPTGDVVVARLRLSNNADSADPSSELIVLRIDHRQFPNHNGGQLQFGPDGFLYVGVGDGGSEGDPEGNGQKLDTLLGKILRLDVDAATPYAVPRGNPFLGQPGVLPEIWAYGLRNPWRFSFDRPSGDLWIADVGQDQYEEVDLQPPGLGGLNYGWSLMEGLHPYAGEYREGLTLPVWEYEHSQGCAITGGYVYRGRQIPELVGDYLFSDYCSGKLWALYRTPEGNRQAVLLLETGLNVSSFGEDARGELYLLDLRGGVYELVSQGA
ncbi:MAG: PQQ-dependent sugar dehydrogenase [Anaerolineales bacterium]|jgi:glucose/arabinose dehydrogenase